MLPRQFGWLKVLDVAPTVWLVEGRSFGPPKILGNDILILVLPTSEIARTNGWLNACLLHARPCRFVDPKKMIVVSLACAGFACAASSLSGTFA